MSRRFGRALAASVAVVALLAGCAASTTDAPPAATGAAPSASPTSASTPVAAERTAFRIASLKGPTTMGLVGLMDDATDGRARHDYQVTVYGTPDEVVETLGRRSEAGVERFYLQFLDLADLDHLEAVAALASPRS